MRFIILLLLGLLNLQACSLVDDYILGKDNTVLPSALTAIHPKVHLLKQWTSPVAKSFKSRNYLKLKPVQLNGVIYTASPEGQVTATRANSGQALWSVTLKQAIVSGPSIGQGIVVLGTDDAELVALSLSGGQKLWTAQMSEDSLAKVLITQDLVISKTVDGQLYAFDRHHGQQKWLMEHGSPDLILRTSSAPILYGDTVLAGFSDGKLDGIELETGRIAWQRSIVYASGSSDVERLVDIGADPIRRGQSVYLASYQGYVGAFNVSEGQWIWSKPASVYKNMALDKDTLYLSDTHDEIWAYDAANGQIKWKQSAFKGRKITEPVMSGPYLVLADGLGYLHVLSKKTGDIIGRLNLGAGVDISPLSSQGQLIVESSDGLLSSFRLQAQS